MRQREVTAEKPPDLRPGDECVYDIRSRQYVTLRAAGYNPPLPVYNCVNCGAPREPECSYCGTHNATH